MKKQFLNGNIRKIFLMFLCFGSIIFGVFLSGCNNMDKQISETVENENAVADMEMSESTSAIREENDFSYSFFTVENPGFSYYNDGTVDTANPSQAIILKEWYQQTNEIVDELEWFQKINAEIPRWNYEDEYYRYELSDIRVCIYSLDGDLIAELDFSQFRFGEEYKEEDYPFIDQKITHAKARDGILYAATSHNTYSASCPQNAYITAVDLSDGHVIWKTEALTCNSYNFEIIGDNIVCGHGFTDEKDYLKIVDRRTGVVLEEIPVASQIYYLILKNDMLYVRTYNTDYCFVVLADERNVFIPENIKNNTPEEILNFAVMEVRRDIAHYENAGKSHDAWEALKGVEVEEARISGITPIKLGQMAEAHEVRMYLLEWRLKTNKNEDEMLVGGMSTEEIDGELWLTEQDSGGSPYVIFAKNSKGKWEYVGTTSQEIIDQDFGTPEMIEYYTDSYTANAMEYYFNK